MTTTVVFDRELRHLSTDDAEAWRAWLIQHQLSGLDIACPSAMTYRDATRRKLSTLEVELLTRDKSGSFRSKKTITVAPEVLPFPGGYKVTRQDPPQRRTKATKQRQRSTTSCVEDAKAPESAWIA